MVSTVTINDDNLRSKLDFTKSIALFIHGWRTSAEDTSIKEAARELSHQRDLNVCRVQWVALSKDSYFTRMLLRNRKIVGDYTSKFVQYLLIQGFTIDNIMCVGHSLGAHICGTVGSNLGGSIPVIIALDAAGIGFTLPVIAGPSSSRLDTTDAKFVQAIHTCDYGAGTIIPIGHQDIYVDSGICSFQKGCTTNSCAHNKAVDIFKYSLNSTDKLCKTIKCANRTMYFLKQCTGGIEDYLGLDAVGFPGEFYLSVDEIGKCRNTFYL